VHWLPGPVATQGLPSLSQKVRKVAAEPGEPGGGGECALFLATSDRCAVLGEGLVPMPEGLEVLKKSGGGILLFDLQGQSADNESSRVEETRRR
jgi:hypothetical protein